MQQFDRTLHGIEPIFCNSSQLTVYVFQIFTQATQIVGAIEKGIEGRHAPFVGQFEGFGQVDAPIPKALQSGDQIGERAHRSPERLGQLAVGIGQVEQDIAGRRSCTRCIKTRIGKRSQQRRSIPHAESKSIGHGRHDGHCGFEVAERQRRTVCSDGQRSEHIFRIVYIQPETPQRSTCKGRRFGK